MTIKDLIKKLDNLSTQVDDLPEDSLRQVLKTISDIRDEIDNLSETLGDEGIDKEETEEE